MSKEQEEKALIEEELNEKDELENEFADENSNSEAIAEPIEPDSSNEEEEIAVTEPEPESSGLEKPDSRRKRKKLNVSIPADEFDWDAFEDSSSTEAPKEDVEKLYN
ncbi:MAG: hypothetical protein LBH60_09400, partial [Prevotellaceae bacterium]|nr:hypothetical protein [Prevotellaceae bacterium]